jgi:glutathione S-transferase
MYTLYVIPGSHPCRAAMLMLEHKGLPYRRVDFIPPTHPVMARLHGFDAGSQRRAAGSKRTFGLVLGDRLATVPGLAAGHRRISTNHGIARFLDERHPDPPLLPDDPAERRAVEEAERWANETFQMAARRIVLAWTVRDPEGSSRAGARGRMGYLLYKRRRARRVVTPWIGRNAFNAAGAATEAELMAELPAQLDHIDALIRDGVLGGAQPNVADLMVAPSLAIVLYRPDVMPLFRGRPALELVDRLLPEPAG